MKLKFRIFKDFNKFFNYFAFAIVSFCQFMFDSEYIFLFLTIHSILKIPILFKITSCTILILLMNLEHIETILHLVLLILLIVKERYWIKRGEHENLMNERKIKNFEKLYDRLTYPIYIVSKDSSKLFYKNTAANDINLNPFQFLEGNIKKRIFTEGTFTREYNQKAEFYQILLSKCTWKNQNAILIQCFSLTILSTLNRIHSDQCEKIQLKTLKLIENLESEFIKWRNLQSLKVIKEADLKELATCIMKSYSLENIAYDKKVLHTLALKAFKLLPGNFNLKYSLVYVIELMLLDLFNLFPEIELRFEESYDFECYGDYQAYFHLFYSLIESLIKNLKQKSQTKLSIHCKLKEILNERMIIMIELWIKNNDEISNFGKSLISNSMSKSSPNLRISTFFEEKLNQFPVLFTIFNILNVEPSLDIQKNNMILSFTFPTDPSVVIQTQEESKINKLQNPLNLNFIRHSKNEKFFSWRTKTETNPMISKSAVQIDKTKTMIDVSIKGNEAFYENSLAFSDDSKMKSSENINKYYISIKESVKNYYNLTKQYHYFMIKEGLKIKNNPPTMNIKIDKSVLDKKNPLIGSPFTSYDFIKIWLESMKDNAHRVTNRKMTIATPVQYSNSSSVFDVKTKYSLNTHYNGTISMDHIDVYLNEDKEQKNECIMTYSPELKRRDIPKNSLRLTQFSKKYVMNSLIGSMFSEITFFKIWKERKLTCLIYVKSKAAITKIKHEFKFYGCFSKIITTDKKKNIEDYMKVLFSTENSLLVIDEDVTGFWKTMQNIVEQKNSSNSNLKVVTISKIEDNMIFQKLKKVGAGSVLMWPLDMRKLRSIIMKL